MPAPRDPTTVRVPGAGDVPIGVDPNSQSGIPSNLPGTIPGGWDPAYGGVPQIPDPIASAWQAIGGDLSTLPQLFTLGNAYNLFNFGQQQQELAGTPSYQNVLSLMGGQVPRDVLDQLQQGAAERAIGTGQQFGDSPNANAAYLRALGLSSIDLQKLGQQEYGALAGLYPMGAPFNLMNFLTTPEQMQAALFAANQSAAAPNPRAAADEEFRKLL